MNEQLKVDQEFTHDKIAQMSNSFVRYYFEMASTEGEMDDSHMDKIFEIVLLKHGTNLELPDELLDIVTTIREMDNVDSILKQFPKSEVQRAFEQIKLALDKADGKFRQFLAEE